MIGARASAATVLMLALSASVTAYAQTETYSFDIPATDVASALRTFARQAHQQVVFDGDLVRGKTSAPVSGTYTAAAAIKALLTGTGLEVRTGTNREFQVLAPAAGPPSTPQEPGAGARSSEAESTDATPRLEEVLVTAQKREERVQDVPVSVTVINPDDLAENGQNRLVDYFATVPGLSLSSNAFFGGSNYITIRGLSAGFAQNPTVATVIDDVPVGSSQFLAFGSVTSPDLDPSDLARIEVLKGPQGALYGADSLGGLIKYVTADPLTSAVSGRAEVAGMGISNGGAGYAVRAAANIPLTDTLAIRVSGFSRRDPGYVDDLTTGKNDINTVRVYGGHLAMLFRPSEDLSLKLGALIQNTDGDGTGFINSNMLAQFPQGDLQQTGLPGSNSWYTRWQLYTANLNTKLAGVEIVSVTGYNVNTLESWQDLTGFSFATTEANKLYPGSTGYNQENYFHTEKITQEIRLSSAVQNWLDWLAGGFYTHETSPGTRQTPYAANIDTGALTGPVVSFNYFPLTFSEYAFFGDLTFHIADQFDVQLGGRQSWNKISYQNVDIGPAVPDYFPGQQSPFFQPMGHASDSPFTYLVTPKYVISPDLQIYARIASGYRIGGPNVYFGPGTVGEGIPTSYKADKTTNYELGVKGSALDHRLSFDAAAYYINWKDFQLGVLSPHGIGYTTNAGAAKSEGFEFSIEAHPAEGLTLAVQGSYNNAVLKQDLPLDAVNYGIFGLAGDRLPYSIRTSGGLTANQDIHLSGDWVGFFGGAINYVGSRPYEFSSSATQPRTWMPAYTQFNLRTGARYQSWLINLYVNNVANKRGVVGLFTPAGNLNNPGGWLASVIQPRTVGLNFARTFERRSPPAP